jgi:hypothetical protein
MATYRTVVEHPDFTASRRVLDLDPKLLDAALEGVIDVVARRPKSFGVVRDTKAKLRVAVVRDRNSKPLLLIYFSHDDETVTLEYLHVHDPQDTEY